MSCNHATSGCEYPSGECTGACLAQSKPAAPKRYLTIVYEIHSSGQEQALLHAAAHEAAQYCHAIEQRDELLNALNHYRAKAHSFAVRLAEIVKAEPDTRVTEKERCPLCRYQHGHAIGCENNPVDQALRRAVIAKTTKQ